MGAPAARVYELSKYWVQMGHDVIVLTGFPNHPTGKIHRSYKKEFRRFFLWEYVDGIRVFRTWLLPFPNGKPYERVLNYLSFFLSSALSGLRFNNVDIIISTTPQLLVGLTGVWLGKCFGVPNILEIRDLWPESIVDSGIGSENSFFINILKNIANFLYKKSTHIVVVTPAFKNELIKRWHVHPSKISIIENGVETDLFSSNGELFLFDSEKNKNEKFTISYIGTLGYAHGLDILLDVAKKLKHQNLRFLIVGEGAQKEKLVRRVSSECIDNVQIIAQQPRELIPSIIRASDICLVLLRNAPVFRTVIPTKMLEFMSCAKPVILSVDGQARQILEKAKAGIFVKPGDIESLQSAIVMLYKNKKLREYFGQNARKFIEENFTREKTAEKYIDLLGKLVFKSL